ncbi:YciI family protein [Isoptericola sp. b441]|uniref:YciI family protein n=1 Tax=Actinotalea lenta TaxID=3064654 RepID=A0ABT9D837_9CELL|nr:MULTISPECIES: YciI family protein [unclassified Isoptericola]MDO8107045.1 YciI family protein [Isoptericola sp. b441]MDO8121246.1 YciI family protein [Isoptericola sp. b490]
MARYLISFDRGWMRFPEADLPDVARDAHAVAQEAIDAGVLVFTGGIGDDDPTQVVGTDGAVTDGPWPETKELVGGFMVVDVPTRDDAVAWAAKIAVACRCAQEVRAFLPDPFVDEFLAR